MCKVVTSTIYSRAAVVMAAEQAVAAGQVTVDQAWDMLSEKQKRELINDTATKNAAFKERLFRRGKKAAAKLYQRDWKSEAEEAAHGTMGCSYPQEVQAACCNPYSAGCRQCLRSR